MSPKITIEQVRKEFSDRGYVLTSKNYRKSEDNLECLCPNGHKMKISRHSFKKGCGCMFCQGKKLYPDDVHQVFYDRGFYPLTEYKDLNSAMTYICPNFHIHKTSFEVFRKSKIGCKICYDAVRYKNRSFNMDYALKIFKENNCILLDKHYMGTKNPMLYICECRRISKISVDDLKYGHRCFDCGRKKVSESKRGEKAWNWKGGVSSLYLHLRAQLGTWKYDVLKSYNFNCDILGSNDGTLEIHHLHSFSEIMDEVMEELDLPILNPVSLYSQKELRKIEDTVRNRHTIDIGVPLTEKLHEELHRIYGYNATKEDYYQFKSDYQNGLIKI